MEDFKDIAPLLNSLSLFENNAAPSPLSPPLPLRLQALCDGDLTTDQARDLARTIITDPQALDHLAELLSSSAKT